MQLVACRRAASISSVISGTSSGSPVRITAGAPVAASASARVALLQLARERHLRRVVVRDRELGDRPVGLDDVHGAPVGDVAGGELRDLSQRLAVVERARQRVAGARR